MLEQITRQSIEMQPIIEAGIKPLEQSSQAPDTILDNARLEHEAHLKDKAIKAAGIRVKEANEAISTEALIGDIDFSKDKYRFIAADSYQAEATTGEYSTRLEGNEKIGNPFYKVRELGNENKWGNPKNEAHYSGQPVERVGIRKGHDSEWTTIEKRVPAPGLRGKLGFKTTIQTQEARSVEPTYTFDYEFAAPSHSDDKAALDVGNRTGQNIRLSLNITKEQAEQLSEKIADDPTIARKILDAFVSKTGDKEMWEADIFTEKNEFIDPASRYGRDFLARDVRPRYQAMPDLQPEVVSLLDRT